MSPRKPKPEIRAQALERLDVRYVPVGSINPNTYNPNRQSEHDFELLTRSMREDGFTQPVVAVDDPKDPGRYVIVDGEHRWRAARDLGYEEIPLVVVPMTPEQARIATLRHNRARGSEDIELTAAVIRDLNKLGALDWAQDSLMLDEVELNRFLDDIPDPDLLPPEDYEHAGTLDDVEELRGKEREARKERDNESFRAKHAEAGETYRISLMFTGEEAELVKSVLGRRPAETLLALCHEELAATA